MSYNYPFKTWFTILKFLAKIFGKLKHNRCSNVCQTLNSTATSLPPIHSKVCRKWRSKALRKFRGGKRICIRCTPQYASLIQLSFLIKIKRPFFLSLSNNNLESIIFVCSRTKNKLFSKMNESTLCNIILIHRESSMTSIDEMENGEKFYISQFDYLDRISFRYLSDYKNKDTLRDCIQKIAEITDEISIDKRRSNVTNIKSKSFLKWFCV